MPEGMPKTWTPASPSAWRSRLGRFLSILGYPVIFPYSVFSLCPLTEYNAKWWRVYLTTVGLAGSITFHTLAYKRFGKDKPLSIGHLLSQYAVFDGWDLTYGFMAVVSTIVLRMLKVKRTNRLEDGNLHGPKVIVIGNGPSAMDSGELGSKIDEFDEVVRFNNFQTKTSGLSKFVGTKCTVHFSDGVLFPTYDQYYTPGATIMLSLFADRFMVAGSYLILRFGVDFQFSLAYNFMMDPELSWIKSESIERLKKAIGLKGPKHPTSGMLAIDYFVNKPGVQLPIYIHGFDFFMGPKFHYYHEQEPLYERINNYIGVNMHSPHKEKGYVEQLIAEGKVKFLKDM